MPHANPQPLLDNKYLWNTDSPGSRLHAENYASTSSRPVAPPLPPTPPPFSTPMAQSSSSNSGQHSSLHSQIQLSGPNLTSFPMSPFTQPLLITRPATPGNLYDSSSQQHSQIQSGSLSMRSPQHSIQSVQPQPPPPPPPQPSCPHPSQNLAVPVQFHQFEQMMPMQQHSVQVPMQSLQMQQQPPLHISQIQLLYQPHQQEHLSLSSQPLLEPAQHKIETDSLVQQQSDPAMTLQQFFASPEAIQVTLLIILLLMASEGAEQLIHIFLFDDDILIVALTVFIE